MKNLLAASCFLLLILLSESLLAQQSHENCKEIETKMIVKDNGKNTGVPSVPYAKMTVQERLNKLNAQYENGKVNIENYQYEKARLEAILKSKDER